MLIQGNFSSIKKLFRELNTILTVKQKRQSIAGLVVIVFSAVFELLGVTAILPFLQVLLTPEKIMQNENIRPLLAFFHIRTSIEMMILIGCGLILLYVVKNLYMIWSNYIKYSYSARVQKELSIKMLYSYMERPYTYFLDTNSSEILRGCESDTNAVYTILSDMFTIISELLTMSAIGAFVMYTEPIMAIAILLLMMTVMFGIILFFKPIAKRLGKKMMKAQSRRYQIIYQTITGIKELFVMQRKKLFIEDFEDAAESVRKTQRNCEFITASQERIIEGVCVSGLIGIVVLWLASGVDILAFVPKLGAFAMAAFKILPSIGKVSSRATTMAYSFPRLENVYHNVVEAKEYEKQREKYVKENIVNKNVEVSTEFEQVLSINHVEWKYREQIKPVLENVTLEIRRGESIALIGESGSGKTTLSDIILGLLHPQKGSVYMDGIDVYGMPEEWAKVIGYVPQSVFLIDDTIRNNVAFGLKNVDDTDIWYALEQAQLKKFVESLPEGLDTMVGEQGIKFSGGQRQRVAIARALFSRPQILVLDEATAALDNETEAAVMEAIDALQGKMTLIIVAHRLSTIRNCDKIYEICNGRAELRKKVDILKG